MKHSAVNDITTHNQDGDIDQTLLSNPEQSGLTANAGSLWQRIVLVAVAYIGFALAGQLLSGPVTQAPLIWPPAGLALAVLLAWGPRLWPGLWIGAFLFHFWLETPLDDVAVAAFVATAATLQALFAARLTRHLLDAPIPLAREGDVFRFLLLGGPLSCLVSASITIPAIYLIGHITAEHAMTLWLFWWTGDTLGVLLFTPLILASPIAGTFQLRSGSRITLPLLITTVLLLSGNLGLTRLEESQAQEAATRQMERAYDNGFHQLSLAREALHGVERFLASSEEVTPEEFASFAGYIVSQSGIHSIDWAPRVLRKERLTFEAAQLSRGGNEYRLFDLDAQGQPFPSGERDEYFPVRLTEPSSTNSLVLGLDHGFNAQRRDAMARARDSGNMSATAAIPLIRTQQQAILAFMPVYRQGFVADAASVNDRRQALRGFVVGTFNVEQLLAPLHREAETNQLLYRVNDITPGEKPSQLCGELPTNDLSEWHRMISFADRLWQLEMQPAVAYWQPWSSLPSRIYLGLSVLGAFLISFASLSAAGRNAVTAVEIFDRTAELANELHNRRAAEAEIRRLNLDLERKVGERTRALEALHSKEEELSIIVDKLPYGLVTIDDHGIIHNANPALETVLGYSPDEIIGNNISMLMPEPDRSQHDSYITRYLSTNESRIIDSGREVNGLHKDGRLVPLELAVNEFRVHGKRFFVGSLYDISDRKLFIEELTKARLDAEQASRAKSTFLAIMSHEIRTPMNGVIGLVDVLAHSRLSDYQADLIRTIRESATTLLNIIDDILDFSKIDAGRMTIENNPVCIADTVEGLCTTLFADAAKKGVELSLFISPDIPERVMADALRLRQVLSNLIGNAIKFSANQSRRKGRVSIRVELAEPDPLRLSFSISDNGIGMNRETLDKLFTPFTQAEASTTRRFGGTGLGLAISRRLVDLMQGEITVTSRPYDGTTFTISLPFDALAEQPIRPLPELSGIACIVVESSDYSTADLVAYLEHGGASLQVAADTHSAAQIAAGLSAPVVAIQYVDQGSIVVDEALRSVPNLHHLLITWGRRQRARVEADNVVSLDYPLRRRETLLHAVALAAGRTRPDIGHQVVIAEQPAGGLPTIAEARAQHRLILIAEDDTLNQRVIIQQLTLLGYAAEVADNGKDALRLWRNADYALLLTDLYMPEMDGYELAQTIRREEAGHRHIPIIALTANVLSEEANKAKSAGMDEYLTKPVQLRLLRETLEKWLPKSVPSSTPNEPSQVIRQGPPVDVKVLHEMIGDDPDTVLGLLSDYLESVRHLAQELHSCYAVGDLRQVCDITHKLKSSSRLVGALTLGDLCAKMERSGKDGDKSAIDQAMPYFDDAMAAVEAELTELLDKQ